MAATAGSAAGMAPAADGGGSESPPLPGDEDSGCGCSVPGARSAEMPWTFASWCAGLVALLGLRRRVRALAALAWLAPLLLDLAAGAVTGQSVPAIRVDRPDADRRALAVVTYDGGEVTVGELDDAIAASSPLVQQDALAPAALRDLLERSVRFEMMAIEAERRGYGDREAVRDAIKQNAVHRLLASEVDAKLPPQLQAFDRATPSPERDAMIESLIAEHRKTEPQIARPELLPQIEISAEPEPAPRRETGSSK